MSKHLPPAPCFEILFLTVLGVNNISDQLPRLAFRHWTGWGGGEHRGGWERNDNFETSHLKWRKLRMGCAMLIITETFHLKNSNWPKSSLLSTLHFTDLGTTSCQYHFHRCRYQGAGMIALGEGRLSVTWRQMRPPPSCGLRDSRTGSLVCDTNTSDESVGATCPIGLKLTQTPTAKESEKATTSAILVPMTRQTVRCGLNCWQ